VATPNWNPEITWSSGGLLTESNLDASSENTVWSKARSDRRLVAVESYGNRGIGANLTITFVLDPRSKVMSTPGTGQSIVDATTFANYNIDTYTGGVDQLEDAQIKLEHVDPLDGRHFIENHNWAIPLPNDTSYARYSYATFIVMNAYSWEPIELSVTAYHYVFPLVIFCWVHEDVWDAGWSLETS
jgi:hypothetical protein